MIVNIKKCKAILHISLAKFQNCSAFQSNTNSTLNFIHVKCVLN